MRTKEGGWKFDRPFLAGVPDWVLMLVWTVIPISAYLFVMYRYEVGSRARREQYAASDRATVESLKRESVATGQFNVSATGETTFALVRVSDPSVKALYQTKPPPWRPTTRMVVSSVVWTFVIIGRVARRKRQEEEGELPDDD